MNTTTARLNVNSNKQKNQLIADLCNLTDTELQELGIRRQAIPEFIDDLVAPVPAPLKETSLRNKVHTINPHRHIRRIELQPKD